MYYDMKESGKRIRRLRMEAGLTQEQLADKLNISWSMLSKIEIGNKGVSIDLLIEMAVLFDTTLDYIILGREINRDGVKQQISAVMDQLKALENMV